MKTTEKGTMAKLISTKHISQDGDTNWILREDPIPVIGDEFEVEDISEDKDGTWLRFNKLTFSHPISKFELLS